MPSRRNRQGVAVVLLFSPRFRVRTKLDSGAETMADGTRYVPTRGTVESFPIRADRHLQQLDNKGENGAP